MDKQKHDLNMPVRLLLISNMYPSDDHPTFGIFVKKFEEEILKYGIEIPYKVVIRGRGTNFISKLLKYVSFYWSISSCYFKNDYDIVYVHYIPHSAPLLSILYFLKKRKILINYHGGDLIPLNTFERIVQPLSKYMALKASGLIVPSNFFKNELINKYALNHSGDIENIIIYPSGGIDSTIFYKKSKIDSKRKLGIEESKFCFGFVSRIDTGKGWDIFIEAIAKFAQNDKKDFLGLIVGRGSEEADMKMKIKNLGLSDKIVFLGEQNHNNLSAILNALDLFIFPTKLPESLGLVGLEAMACGVPVIASDIGGIKDYLEHKKNGFLFEVGNSDDLYRKIQDYSMLEDKNSMINATLETATSFFSTNCTPYLVDFIKKYSIS